ncbi:Ribophorin I [Mycotypha africana]|uniref:Ribophorin I n=1 Tax=Mycotypha africana TaxID=64632 RepID=UPI002301B4D4|nr:Ribophorin I [Mycotypha africana]KAI8971840.1 Ribophorin I [Mycotypha africana]
MSVRSLLSFAFALSCLVSFAFANYPVQFENSKVIRVLDVNNAIVREDTGIRAKNIDDKPATEYYIYNPTNVETHTASISAYMKKTKTELEVIKLEYIREAELHIYKVVLNEPVQPGDDILLGIKSVYTHLINPVPATLPQIARQHTLYGFNSYFFSPYHTKEQKTTLYKNVIHHSGAQDKTSAKDNGKIVYGPYIDTQPFSFEYATCHFENSHPFITVTSLRRDIEVSHWGNILAVEEHYAIRNDGAGLDSNFNRGQYMLTGHIHEHTNVLKELEFDLPVSAHDTYYRDEVGNVSTSHFRVEKKKAILELKPRYPLFGGWNYTWHHGYNAALGSYLHKSDSGKYILNVDFVESVKDKSIDKAIVRVIFPEGAKNVKVNTPFDIDSQAITSYSTYFDSTGRIMVVLEKNNLVKEHELPIQIEYDYSVVNLLQKPFVASIGFFVLFSISIVLNRMSFVINSQKEKANLKKE